MRKLSGIALAAILAITLSSCCNKPKEESKMIRLNVTATVYDQYLDEVIDGLNLMAAESQMEDGCIGYQIYQNTVNPNELVIVETWENQETLDAHGQTSHYTTIIPTLKDKMKMKMERFDF